MFDPSAEAARWIRQAENDLEYLRLGFAGGFYSQTCFMCQQAAEKALKALHYGLGERIVIGHSIVRLIESAPGEEPDLSRFLDDARILDQFYIPTRYPNGLPEGSPFEAYTSAQAAEAVEKAESIIGAVRTWLDSR